MDESRLQDYLNLINVLLSCPSGEEEEILNANSELVDAGLVQMMEQVADYLAQQGNETAADGLRSMASQLGERIANSSAALTSEDYVDFLMEVLQITSDTDGEPEQVYPLLRDNLDKLDDNFASLLRDWAMEKLSEVESEQAQYSAGVIVNFSNLIQEFPLGNIASNLEIAITGYEVAATVFTREAFPPNWAKIQNHLAIAYFGRIKGDKAENLESAIGYFQAALSVRTHDASPQDWASTQNNLGIAYFGRIKGDKAENLEAAIRCCQTALSVRTREAFPQDWARTQTNLAIAYSDRIKGDKAENLEVAIGYSQAALSVFTREAFPKGWAITQNNLGEAYRNRIKGDKAENLEAAIGYYQAALSVFTREAFPQNWAMTQNNLGEAYRNRIKGDKAENLESAISSCQAALSVFTLEAFPQNWAAIQNNLGIAYSDRIKGDKAENLEAAIGYSQAALSVRTREAFPQDWAMTQNNLGIAYSDRIKGDKAANLEAAIRYYQAALSVYTCEAFPQEYTETLFNLGLAYQDNNQQALAYDAFAAAIETVDFLRSEIVSGDESKQKLAEKHNQIYQSMVEVCLEMGNYTAAIEYAERSKTRNLVELILNRDLKTIFPLDVVKELEKLRDEIASAQYEIQNAKAENPTTLAQYLHQLRQQRNDLQNRYLSIASGFKFYHFQATLDDHTAIIEWYITSESFQTFIVTRHSPQPFVLSATVDDRNALIDWAVAYINDYQQKDEDNWRIQLTPRLKELAKILHIDQIIEQLPKNCQRLILVPHRYLHLFPLHALPLKNGDFLCDHFPKGVSYAPSCQLLLQAQQRKRPNFTHLFAIQNPTNDLDYTDLEVQAITDYFNPVNILKYKTATLTAINETNLNAIHCAHFSCHGYFNQRNARKSALILADAPLATAPANPDTERYFNVREGETHDLNQCLTLDAILSLNLEQCRLVTLSACETGLIDFTNTSDEYIGLPSGFLIAGSPSVVSSLWRVDDIASAFLMIKFYENLNSDSESLQSDSTVAVALNKAQLWLRDATKEELQEWIEQLSLTPTQEEFILDYLDDLNSTTKPFQSPYYWAAFCAIGQ
jgi:CHAT domain-containing protein